MPGRKPQPRYIPPKPIDVPLHPLRSYTRHDSLRDLVTADLGSNLFAAGGVTSLVIAVRAAINEALAPHKLRLGEDDVFYIDAKPDQDSDLRIGEALHALDVAEVQLHACRRLADAGNAGSARRAAELSELLGRTAEAERWWRRAADLGDRDANAFVGYILN